MKASKYTGIKSISFTIDLKEFDPTQFHNYNINNLHLTIFLHLTSLTGNIWSLNQTFT